MMKNCIFFTKLILNNGYNGWIGRQWWQTPLYHKLCLDEIYQKDIYEEVCKMTFRMWIQQKTVKLYIFGVISGMISIRGFLLFYKKVIFSKKRIFSIFWNSLYDSYDQGADICEENQGVHVKTGHTLIFLTVSNTYHNYHDYLRKSTGYTL